MDGTQHKLYHLRAGSTNNLLTNDARAMGYNGTTPHRNQGKSGKRKANIGGDQCGNVRKSPVRKYYHVPELIRSKPLHMTYFFMGIFNHINVNIWTLLD